MKALKLLIILLMVFSCQDNTKKEGSKEELRIEKITEKETSEKKELENKETENTSTNRFLGYYVGDFKAAQGTQYDDYSYSNKINISIDRIENDSVFGHSIVAGNNRPFSGSFHKDAAKIVVKEPGDDPYDGTFNISLTKDGHKISGNWETFNSKLRINRRTFYLEKRIFRYNKDIALIEDIEYMTLYNKDLEKQNERNQAINDSLFKLSQERDSEEGFFYMNDEMYEMLTEDVLKFNPSNTLLKPEDVANMTKGDLEVLRNSIYARHGYSFKTKKMRYVFDMIDWYIPVSTDVRKELTAIEKQNIDLIKRYEQHAERYYDSFGR